MPILFAASATRVLPSRIASALRCVMGALEDGGLIDMLPRLSGCDATAVAHVEVLREAP